MGISSRFTWLKVFCPRIRMDEPQDLLIWRDQFSRLMIACMAIIFPLSMIYNLPALIAERRYGLIALDVAFWLFMLSELFVFRFSSRVRKPLGLGFLYIMTVAFIAYLGPFQARPAWLVMCTVFAGVFFGVRGAIAAALFDAAIFWALYGLMGPGNKAWAAVYAGSLANWIVFVFNTSLLALASGLAVGFLLNRLDRSLRDQFDAAETLRKRSEELEKAYELLQGEVEQRKIAERALSQSEAQYRLLAENATDVIWTVDMDFKVTYISPSVYRTRGYTQQEVMALKMTDHLTPDSMALATRVLAEELTAEAQEDRDLKRSRSLEVEIIRKDGSIYWSEMNLTFLRDPEGRAVGILGVSRDINERKRADELLRKSEAHFRAVVENSHDGILLMSSDRQIKYMSPSFSRISGYIPQEVVGSYAAGYTHPDDEVMVARKFCDLLQTSGTVFSVEYRIRHKLGHWIWLETTASNLLEDLNVQAVVVNSRDISDRKRAEETLRDSEERYRTLVETSPDAIAVLDLNLKITMVNEQALKSFGYGKQNEVVGKNGWDFFASEERPRMLGRVRELLETGTIKNSEYMGLKKDGTVFPVELRTSVIRHISGEPTAIISVIRDISQSKQTEAARRASEEKFTKAFYHSPIAMSISTLNESRYLDVNAEFVRITEWTREEVIGRTPLELAIWVDLNRRQAILKEMREQGFVHNAEHQSRTKSGKVLTLLMSCEKIVVNDEPCLLVSGIDITEKKRAEEEKARLLSQLSQAQKMEAIGTLAGGIAHDFNNILTAMMGYAELASFDIPGDSKAQYNLQESIKACHRAKDLVAQILAFSRQGEQERKPLDIRPIIKETLKLLRASLPSTIEIRQDIERDLGVILADPSQIHQVLMNLCTNAGHAMSEKGGVLEVSLNQVDLDGGGSGESVGIEPGPYLRLRVRDTGHGMSPEILKRIFDPYFTTKEVGKGTGLGLAMVHGIVKSYGGEITVDTEVNKGSTFDIYFPTAEGVSLGLEVKGVEPLPLGGDERLLFVDDEQAIVEVGKGILEHLGYEVDVRTSSIEALELFRGQADRFDLVITDMTMPNMRGDKLAKEILGIRPGIPIILCTGFSEHISAERVRAIGIQQFVMKPLTMKDLAVAVRTALDKTKKDKMGMEKEGQEDLGGR